MWGFAASPVIYGDWVIVHAAVQPDGCLSAYHRITGEEVWRFAVEQGAGLRQLKALYIDIVGGISAN